MVKIKIKYPPTQKLKIKKSLFFLPAIFLFLDDLNLLFPSSCIISCILQLDFLLYGQLIFGICDFHYTFIQIIKQGQGASVFISILNHEIDSLPRVLHASSWALVHRYVHSEVLFLNILGFDGYPGVRYYFLRNDLILRLLRVADPADCALKSYFLLVRHQRYEWLLQHSLVFLRLEVYYAQGRICLYTQWDLGVFYCVFAYRLWLVTHCAFIITLSNPNILFRFKSCI